ncbi:DUF4124 domain-containing protein [Salinisphaera orenii]|nr:DUF4124 domain-containing protein [Salinisphaera orenii]
MRMLATVVVAVLCATGAAHADIYTWVGADGVRHYSDTPDSSRAERADLPGIQNVEGDPDALQRLQDEFQAGRARGEPPDSRRPELVRPEAGRTFRNARGVVPIALTIGGGADLRDGEQITYYLDGSPIPESPTDETRLELANVARGTHTLSAALLYEGRELRRTEPVTFYVQPPAAISPLNPDSQNGGGDDRGENLDGVATAPPAGNADGAPAAPRFTPGSGGAPSAPR